MLEKPCLALQTYPWAIKPNVRYSVDQQFSTREPPETGPDDLRSALFSIPESSSPALVRYSLAGNIWSPGYSRRLRYATDSAFRSDSGTSAIVLVQVRSGSRLSKICRFVSACATFLSNKSVPGFSQSHECCVQSWCCYLLS